MKRKAIVLLAFLMTILIMLGIIACTVGGKNSLKSKIAAVESAKPNLEESGLWSEDDESILETSRTIAKDTKAQKDLIDYAISELNTIIAKVSLIPEQKDKKELNAKMAEVSALDGTKYTEKSFGELQSVLAIAQEVLKDSKATQENVKLLVEALNNAVSELEYIDDTNNVDKTALADQIEKASAVKNSGYKAECWVYFEEILQFAKDINTKSNSSQAEIDAVAEELKKAQQVLAESLK